MRKVLIISTCKHRLSEEEFVKPLREIAENLGYLVEVRKFTEKVSPDSGKVIISGTALKDVDYLGKVENFEWVRTYDGGILGICAGAHIISLVFGCGLRKGKIIGAREVDFKGVKRRAYFLTSRIPVLREGFEVLGFMDDVPAYFKVRGRNIYGALFYPEVLNKDLIIDFLEEDY